MRIIEEASRRNVERGPQSRAENVGSNFDGVPKQISLDFKRLHQAGFLTPGSRQSRQAEEYRLIKRRLKERLREKGGDPTLNNVIAVTSSRPKEGKTFTSINLALTFAFEENCEVLLVDADVARPNVFQAMSVPSKGDGLTDCLISSESYLMHALQVENLPLKLLSAGGPVPSATELFSGSKMLSLLRKFASDNVVVILDTSPVLATNEPAALASVVGHTIFVVHATETSPTMIERSLDLLGRPANISLLLNKGFAAPQLEQFGSYYSSYIRT